MTTTTIRATILSHRLGTTQDGDLVILFAVLLPGLAAPQIVSVPVTEQTARAAWTLLDSLGYSQDEFGGLDASNPWTRFESLAGKTFDVTRDPATGTLAAA